MKLKVTQTYHDRKEGKDIQKNEIIERDDGRASELILAGVARELKEKPKSEKKTSENNGDAKGNKAE